MPKELQRMATIFANATRSYYKELRYTHRPPEEVLQSNDDPNYHATACIVNYYHGKSVMGIHRDEVELALHQPVISISIGCAGIFLFGGTTVDANESVQKDNENDDTDDISAEQRTPSPPPTSQPTIPILLRSGDVILFGGPNRLNYHSMPRIIPQSFLRKDINTINGNHSRIPSNPHFQRYRQHYQLDVDDVFEDRIDILNESDEMAAIEDYLSNHRVNINIRQVY